jgi:FlaA1/EpsC-like NDP-sugar epimerase
MNSTVQIPTDILSSLVTGRSADLFLPDMELCSEGIRENIFGARILVIGGGGSIGSATVRLLTQFGPRALHVVDQGENKLVELVRDLRSSADDFPVADFRTFPVDYGSPLMHRFLAEMDSYELVFNFAALKHVRSEKDAYSLLQMLDTNVIKAANFLGWLAEKSPECKYFCVSTDKAAKPASLMGASKRIMEHLIFSGEVVPELRSHVTSARFANVAFSDGSLLDSFLKRLQSRRPLAVPRDTRRYFISLSEAGQICLIAAVSAPHRHVLISRLDRSKDLRDLESVACAILQNIGYEPQFYEEAAEAKANFEHDIKKGRYPLLLTDRDTSGEKPFEEFVAEGEKVVEIGLPNLFAVLYVPQRGSLLVFLETIRKLISDPHAPVNKSDIADLISEVVPELSHITSDKNLDDRM